MIRLGGQTSKVQVSVWLFPRRVLQVDEIRNPRAWESGVRGSFYQSFEQYLSNFQILRTVNGEYQ